MNEADALDLVQLSIWTVLLISAPVIGAAMIVGLAVSFLQALTQIQEMTLTFVPKIVVVLVALSLSAPFVGAQVFKFSEALYERIEKGFAGKGP